MANPSDINRDVFGGLFSSLIRLNGQGPIDHHGVRMRVSHTHPQSLLVNNLPSFMINRANLLRRMNIVYSDEGGDPFHNLLQRTPFGNILRQSMDDIGGTKKVASDEMLKSVQDISECADLTNDDECPICMDGFDEKRGIRITCEHAFHKECIVEWLQGDNRCPVCRYEYPHKEISLARPMDGEADNDVEDNGTDDDVEDNDTGGDDDANSITIDEIMDGTMRSVSGPHILQSLLRSALADSYQDELREQQLIQQVLFESIQGLPESADTHDISGSNDNID